MSLSIRETMSKDLITAQYDERLATVFKRMAAARIRHLPVLDDSGGLIGIISDRNLQRAMSPEKPGEFDPNAMVRDYMSEPVLTVDTDSELHEVAERMIEEKVSAYVVMRGQKMVGIVTTDDLLAVLVRLLKNPILTAEERVETFAYNSPIGTVLEILNQVGI